MISQKHKDLAEWYIFVMRELGYDPLNPTRRREFVAARAIIAHYLELAGCTLADIGELLGKNHATIVHYRERFDAMFYPGADAERDLYERFKKEI